MGKFSLKNTKLATEAPPVLEKKLGTKFVFRTAISPVSESCSCLTKNYVLPGNFFDVYITQF